MRKTILVMSEQRAGALRKVTFEALAAARTIGGEGGEVVACAFGPDADKFVRDLAVYGADRAVLIKDEALSAYMTDAYRQALLTAIEHVQPEVVILGHTAIGKDLAPRIAARLDWAQVSDFTAVEMTESGPLFVRPIYAGKAFAKVRAHGEQLLATVRPNNISPLAPDAERSASVEELALPKTDLRTVIREVVRKATSGVDLSEAKIVVAGGRGVKSAEGFKLLRELAEVLGAAVGASRGACDAGYCDYAMQIGQTGKVVTPDLYIACGISGAIQHVAGMSNSKVIVAINKDPEAEIFKIADYGIVGDLFEVVPLLTEELKQQL